MRNRSFTILASAAGTLALTAARPEQSAPAHPVPTTAFVHVSVIPMDRQRILRDQTVLVEGSRIVAIGKAGKVRVPAGAAVVNGRGKFLIPGLADMHVHIEMHNMHDGQLSPEGLLLLWLASGVTTIRNMGGSPEHVALRDRVAQGMVLGPRIYTAGPELTRGMDTPAHAVALVADHKAARYDLIKIHYDPEPGPPEARLTPEAFDTFAAVAHRSGIPFAGHTPWLGVERTLRAHPASIEHLRGYVNYLFDMDTAAAPWPQRDSVINTSSVPDAKIARLAQLTKQTGVWNCPTELVARLGFKGLKDSIALRAAVDNDSIIGKMGLLRRRIIKALSDSGTGLLLGTDGGCCELDVPSGSEVPWELVFLVKAGLTPYQALETATRNPAVFLGTIDSTGTIQVGKRADLVLLNSNPLEGVDRVRSLVGTMIQGRWLPKAELERLLAAAKVPQTLYPSYSGPFHSP